MAPRAIWKGYLKIDELTCPVALHSAASTAERISFHTLNRETGNRVRREYVDEETGKPVEADDQVKGYETGKGEYVLLEPEDIASAVPESDKTLAVDAFVACGKVDTLFFDRPYYLTPADDSAQTAFAVIREGLRARAVAALARGVLFRRVRTLFIRAAGPGLVANTLNFDYEIRPADEVFDPVPHLKIKGEMLDLARHIIETKLGTFDPWAFDDRYDAALAELVVAKKEGRAIKAPKPASKGKVIDLMDALKRSAAASKKEAPKPRSQPKRKGASTKAPARRKAG